MPAFDVVRLYVLSVIVVLTFVHFIVPVFGTFIPIMQLRKRASWVLFWRVVTRFNLFVLAMLEWTFATRRIFPIGIIDGDVLRVLTVVVWTSVAITVLATWLTHPAGARGL